MNKKKEKKKSKSAYMSMYLQNSPLESQKEERRKGETQGLLPCKRRPNVSNVGVGPGHQCTVAKSHSNLIEGEEGRGKLDR